nr:hypothetical protein [uncultured bacterium]
MNATNLHELDSPPWRRVDSTIVNVASDIRSLYDQRFAQLDLSLSTACLVAYLGDFGPVTQTRAADHLHQGRAVTGTQVDRLEARGVLERLPDPTDRRVWLVQLTEAGHKLNKSIIEIDKVVRGELRSGVSRQERQLLAKLLLRLQANLSAALSGDNPSEASASLSKSPSTKPSSTKPSSTKPSSPRPSTPKN